MKILPNKHQFRYTGNGPYASYTCKCCSIIKHQRYRDLKAVTREQATCPSSDVPMTVMEYLTNSVDVIRKRT